MVSTRAKIAVDAMGGDFAPQEIVAGAIRASEELDAEVLLVGDRQQIESCLKEHNSSEKLEIIDAPDVIAMEEEPVNALKRKPKASINVAMELVKQSSASAVVSAGHSGAAMTAAVFRLGRLNGIDRPAIGAVLPSMQASKSVIVLDVGAIMDCEPKYLDQFAVMGTIYSKYILGNEDPKVGLLNIGEEPGKGNKLSKSAYPLLEANPLISFAGNAEGRDALSGKFDVIVCDGFVGNVLLKFTEAIGEVMLQNLEQELSQDLRGSMGKALIEPHLKKVRQRVDHAEHGGALLFGVDGVCVIGHGSSRAPSVYNAIRLAKEAVDNQVIERIKSYNQQHQQNLVAQTASSG